VLPFFPFLITGLFLALVGWGGLAVLVLTTLPTLGPRWLFFFFLTLGVSGLALPVMHILHRRFPSEPPVDSGVMIREAIMLGIYGDLLAWLQLGKVLNPALTVFLAAGLCAIEFLLRLRERSRFKPTESSNE
jgi:hypothetical protein